MRARVGFAMLCREIESEADGGGGARRVLRVLQAAKVSATETRLAAARLPRDLAVFDHEALSDPERARALSVVFVRWEKMDGLGGCLARPRRTPRTPFASAASPTVGLGSRARREPHAMLKLFGHVPDGASVLVRRVRVPAAGAEGAPLDGSTPTETCALRLAAGAAAAAPPGRGDGDAAPGPDPPAGRAPAPRRGDDARLVLDGLVVREGVDGADDAWLGAETRCVLEAGPAPGPAAAAARRLPDPTPNARATKVRFDYLYHRGKLCKTEIVDGMTCPLCLREADAFGALRCHLEACHGRFKFAFFPGGDDARPPARGNVGRAPETASGGGDIAQSDASDDSALFATLVAPRPEPAGPTVRVMCREEDPNAQEQAEREEWEWFNEHGGWYASDPKPKETLLACAGREFVFASRRYPLRPEARAALAEAHREEVKMLSALRRQEEEAFLKARHRARRVEAQTKRRRREREERLARDEARLQAQSAEHHAQRLLLLRLANMQFAVAARTLDPARTLEGVPGMAHPGNSGVYPGFAPAGGLGFPRGIPGNVPGITGAVLPSAIPGGVRFVPEPGYNQEILRQMRLRELEATERLMRLETERAAAAQDVRGAAALAVAEEARTRTRNPQNDDDDDAKKKALVSPLAEREAATSLPATAARAADLPGNAAKRPLPSSAPSSSREKRRKSRGYSPKGGASVNSIIAEINRDLAAQAAEGLRALKTADARAEAPPGASNKRKAREAETAKGKAPIEPPAPTENVGAARKGAANAESRLAREKKRDPPAEADRARGAPASLPGTADESSGDGHGVGPPGTAYHARTAMPMACEAGTSFGPTRDSDDEEDALQWAREDYRRLVDFKDIAKDEKVFMHEWNAFVKRFHHVGDVALPAALEAFAHYRGAAISGSKTFKRLFALHVLNAFEFGIVPATTIDACMRIVESYGSGKGAARRAAPGIGGAIGIPGIGDASGVRRSLTLNDRGAFGTSACAQRR